MGLCSTHIDCLRSQLEMFIRNNMSHLIRYSLQCAPPQLSHRFHSINLICSLLMSFAECLCQSNIASLSTSISSRKVLWSQRKISMLQNIQSSKLFQTCTSSRRCNRFNRKDWSVHNSPGDTTTGK